MPQHLQGNLTFPSSILLLLLLLCDSWPSVGRVRRWHENERPRKHRERQATCTRERGSLKFDCRSSVRDVDWVEQREKERESDNYSARRLCFRCSSEWRTWNLCPRVTFVTDLLSLSVSLCSLSLSLRVLRSLTHCVSHVTLYRIFHFFSLHPHAPVMAS